MTDLRALSEPLFPIQCSTGYAFEPGLSASGEQVLIGLVTDGVVAVFFSPDGGFRRADFRPVDFSPAAGLPRIKQRETEDALLCKACRAWEEELGFVQATIRVFSFWLPKWLIGTATLPEYLLLFLRNPQSDPDEKRQQRCNDDIAEFRREGNYILWWRTEYWMDRNGHIFAT